MTDPPGTTAKQLVRAAEIGAEEGLRFVYAGNAPGQVGQWENTWCPQCRALLIERTGYLVRDYRITPDCKCPQCRSQVPGIWPANAQTEVRTSSSLADYRSRFPRRVELI